jgi:sulfide:quinone oxidoreductase
MPVVTSSTTARCSPSSRAHTLIPRTSHRLQENPAVKKPETLGDTRRAPLPQPLTPPTETSGAPKNASTWRPQDSPEAFGGLLRDLEEGYVKRVAFVIPPGPVWPLPAYELALMTSREVWSMGINDTQITVITPEAIPLARFGSAAAIALREELKAAAVRLDAATTPRVNRDHDLKIVLQPTVDALQVDRVIALPGLQGPRIPGSTQDKDGFIPVNYVSRMRDSTDIWAAGDAIAYPIKFGGLATQQADMIAADIAARVGARPTPTPAGLHLQGMLITGAAPRPLAANAPAIVARAPLWQPADKIYDKYLTPYLHATDPTLTADPPTRGVEVNETLPGLEHDER